MPNKTMTMQVDLIPAADGTYKLGDATHKWVINGETISAISNSDIDDIIDDVYFPSENNES